MKSSGAVITLCCVLFGATAICAQSRQEPALTNSSIVKLVKAGFKEKTIVLMISARAPNFDLSPDRMIELKRAGVSENIIIAMLTRQEGMDPVVDDDSWGDDPIFSNNSINPSRSGSRPNSDGSTDIFGSSSGVKSKSETRGGQNGSASGESTLTGSATVRILRPPTEAGGTAVGSKLEKTKSLTNDSIVELVEAGFSEGTIIRRIEQSPVNFDLAATKLEELRKRRVSEKILAAMKIAMGEDAK